MFGSQVQAERQVRIRLIEVHALDHKPALERLFPTRPADRVVPQGIRPKPTVGLEPMLSPVEFL